MAEWPKWILNGSGDAHDFNPDPEADSDYQAIIPADLGRELYEAAGRLHELAEAASRGEEVLWDHHHSTISDVDAARFRYEKEVGLDVR